MPEASYPLDDTTSFSPSLPPLPNALELECDSDSHSIWHQHASQNSASSSHLFNMTRRRKVSKKKTETKPFQQTRLALTPLEASSPQSKGYHQQIQDLAATVNFTGSPTSSRKNDGGTQGSSVLAIPGQDDADTVPTPGSLSEYQPQDFDSPAEKKPAGSSKRSTRLLRSSRRRKMQQRLDFTGGSASKSSPTPVKVTTRRQPAASKPGIFASSQRRGQIRLGSSYESEDTDETPMVTPPPTRSNGLRSRREVDTSGGRVTRSSQNMVCANESSAEDTIVVGGREAFRLVLIDEDDEEEEELPTTLGTRRRVRKAKNPPSDFISSPSVQPIEDDDNDDSGDVEIIDHPRKKRRAERDSDEYDGPIPSDRRKAKLSKIVSRRVKDDLEEDLAFLGPSSDVEEGTRRPRNTQTREKDARQRALALLKGKRSSQPAPQEQERDAEWDSADHEAAADEEEEIVTDEGEEIATEDEQDPMSSRGFFEEDEDDRDFVEEGDEETTLGAPDSNIPIQFTKYATMRAKELFKFAVEWMVQKRINPAFSRTDEIYELTFKKLDDEIKGLAGSKFESSAWMERFVFALKARPEIKHDTIDRTDVEHMMRNHCDACNRTSHPATYAVQFLGTPYHRHTLDDVTDSDDSDSDSATDSNSHASGPRTSAHDDQPDRDAQGHLIPPVNTVFYVGKFCMANAWTAHALEHWRHHLNEYVMTWLTRAGYDAPDRVARRDRWPEAKRRRHANRLVDRMEREGVLRDLWRDFRQNIETARNAKRGRWDE